ncbi:hypothetical protein CN918_27790 [Priestia megaterium]|nr:hypothetical protein CN918_27790 [Priestia megaterium]
MSEYEKFEKHDKQDNQKQLLNLDEEGRLSVVPVLPLNPDVSVIRENLSIIPAELEYWQGLAAQKKAEIQDVKTYIKGKHKSLELYKSKIRAEGMKKWKEEMKEYLPNVKRLFAEYERDPNMNKIIMQQLIKDLRPEKPTKNDLDDLANLKTEGMQKEIHQFEKKVNALESEYEALKIKINLYENTYISVRAHVRLLERQYERTDR